MEVSVVITVLNEEASIGSLLESLLSQTKLPQEIVLVDGGSHDGTRGIIKNYIEKNDIIHLFEDHGSIAHGRNVAVKKSRCEIIAQIDGGCVAHKTWLERITEPFKDSDVGLVAGFYRMVGNSSFQHAIAPYHGVPVEWFDPRVFMPSGRSMAFRRKVWEEIGGYSEYLERAGEDTLFNYQILKKGIKIKRVQSAVVDWQLPETFGQSLRKLYSYAKGDAQAAIWWHPAQKIRTHSIKIISILLRYIVFALLFITSMFLPFFGTLFITSVVLYLFWSIWKLREVVVDPIAKLWIPVIQVSSDVTVLAGFVSGFLQKKDI